MSAYTDDTVLTWGKYKFTRLKVIPASWLLSNARVTHDKDLREYVQENKERLIEREKLREPPPEIIVPCDKYSYISEEQAKKHIREIQNSKFKYERTYNKHKVPVRAYPCSYCKGWHLTSKK